MYRQDYKIVSYSTNQADDRPAERPMAMVNVSATMAAAKVMVYAPVVIKEYVQLTCADLAKSWPNYSYAAF